MAKLAPAEDLRAHWNMWCDADPFDDSDTFVDRMEAAGFVSLVPVDEQALEDPFAWERGIVPGGMMWQLTDAGLIAFNANDAGDRS